MPDILKTVMPLLIALCSLAGLYIEHTDKVAERNAKEAKADTIALFIQHQNKLNEKLHILFAIVDSNNQLSTIADSTKAK